MTNSLERALTLLTEAQVAMTEQDEIAQQAVLKEIKEFQNELEDEYQKYGKIVD